MSKKLKNSTRINKFISNSGFCSRRKADEFILNGLVKINNKIITDFSYCVTDNDIVVVNGKQLLLPQKKYFILNKPKNTITTVSDDLNRTTVVDIININDKSGLHPVGRLDRNTTGVLFLTNDGDFTNKLTHPTHKIPKIYIATLNNPISKEHLSILTTGITINNKTEYFDDVSIISGSKNLKVAVLVHSGRYHFVKDMFEYVGYKVKYLDRISVATITYKGLKRGQARELTKNEVNYLLNL